MNAQLHYFETHVAIDSTPLAMMTHLARTGSHETYMVYEREDEWNYAGGVWSEIILTSSGICGRLPDGSEVQYARTSDSLAQIDTFLNNLPIVKWNAYGWAAFELSYILSNIPYDDRHHPLLHLFVPRVEVRVKNQIARVQGVTPEDLCEVLTLLENASAETTVSPTPVDVRTDQSARYLRAVRDAVDEINAGQLEKVILSRVIELEDEIDLPLTYLTGRRANHPARSFLVNVGRAQAAGFSPEIVVRVDRDGLVTSQPLAGTRAIATSPEQNDRLRAELLSDPKEIYEHAISVKTGTDELTDVCIDGTIEVPEFMTIRERGSVQHLASRVSGRLRGDRSSWDAFAAVFPAVTASGVPKRAAYECIQRHEDRPRDLYSGSVLTLSSEGEMDAALVLRSVYQRDGVAWLRAGAGIVGQSTPEREFEETCEKLASVSQYVVTATAEVVDSERNTKAEVLA